MAGIKQKYVRYFAYTYTSNMQITKKCCFTTKQVHFSIAVEWFAFPTEQDFRVALKRVEEDLKPAKENSLYKYCSIL